MRMIHQRRRGRAALHRNPVHIYAKNQQHMKTHGYVQRVLFMSRSVPIMSLRQGATGHSAYETTASGPAERFPCRGHEAAGTTGLVSVRWSLALKELRWPGEPVPAAVGSRFSGIKENFLTAFCGIQNFSDFSFYI
ncbi:hypothetical protein ATANTOWER_019907 [Ataeniobius toweri]|uniref:Uncharacterized protein n=1 Tax=Ataeniobius toweri TaxID=208326 RepID=A0ABU7BXD2_9TELE|nr:hypothetical protein [Ataeniobius toweri]